MARGDHIKVRRWRGLYTHHGIDMGDGTVIHLAGEPLRARRARVCRTDMATFLAGGRARVVPYPRGARPADEVIAAAEAGLARGGYCLGRNNCEHFATRCKTGKPMSRQVMRVLWACGTVTGAAAVTIAALATAGYHRKTASRSS